MKKDKNELHKRLAKYGLLTVAIAGANTAEGAIIYTDETPDFAGGIGSQYFLDLNNDGTDDFRIWHNGSSNLYVSPLAAANEVLGSGGATYAYPFAMSAGSTISAGAGSFFNNGFSGGFQSLNYGSCSFGNWCTVTDRYLGLKFEFAGNTHYGWVRLDVNASGSVWSIKDYAYNDVIGGSIDAGDVGTISPPIVTADGVTGIVGTDIGELTDGTDLEVSFTAATDETTVSEYRMIAVKEANVGTFDLVAAQALVLPQYLAVTPNASPSYTQTFNAADQDADGDVITINEPYRIFVLSVADGTIATLDSLVDSGSPVTLNTTTDVALSIVGTDISENSNGTDLQVDFDAAVLEPRVSEYRVIAVKETNVGTFDLAAAQALVAPQYIAVAPTGAPNYTQVFSATDQDSDGDLIVTGESYRIFVLSIADGTISNIDAMADSGTPVTINTTTDIALSIVGTDISDNANGTDLQVDFIAAVLETRVSEYRVIAVKSGTTFNLADAEATLATSYIAVTPTGAANYTQTFGAASADSDGDAITEGQPYVIYILSLADGTISNLNALTNSAGEVTLISYIGLDENALDAIMTYSNGEQFVVETPAEMLGQDLNVSIVSMTGAIVKTLDLKDATTKINHLDLKSGVYIVRILDSSGNQTTKKIAI